MSVRRRYPPAFWRPWIAGSNSRRPGQWHRDPLAAATSVRPPSLLGLVLGNLPAWIFVIIHRIEKGGNWSRDYLFEVGTDVVYKRMRC